MADKTLTRTEKRAADFVRWFVSVSDFYENRRFGVSSDDILADSERWDRCADAAENGADGSTHYEHIQDMRSLFSDFVRFGDRHHKRNPWSAGYRRFEDAVSKRFDDIEAWHEKNGTLHQEVG